jgi:very-short-patch-repair endonuclease
MYGYDFHRKPIDNYILDFFLLQLMLGIEVGYSHEFFEVYERIE